MWKFVRPSNNSLRSVVDLVDEKSGTKDVFGTSAAEREAKGRHRKREEFLVFWREEFERRLVEGAPRCGESEEPKKQVLNLAPPLEEVVDVYPSPQESRPYDDLERWHRRRMLDDHNRLP